MIYSVLVVQADLSTHVYIVEAGSRTEAVRAALKNALLDDMNDITSILLTESLAPL